MKKLFYYSLIVVVVIGLAQFLPASQKKEARVTQVVKDVRLLAKAGPRPASLNDNVSEGTAIRTGGDSRAELTFPDQSLTRLGANTVFSFGGAKGFDLSSGAILLSVPASAGTTRVNMGAVTAAVSGFTAMFDHHARGWCKFIVLHGDGSIWLKKRPRDKRRLQTGQIIVFPCNTDRLPEVHYVDLKKLLKGKLVSGFHRPLPEINIILAEADKQPESPPEGGYIDPTSQDALDQAAAATVEDHTPRPRHTEPPPQPTEHPR